MNIVQKIAKNTVLLVFMQIVLMFLGFVFTAYLARYLGADNFGKYSFAFSFTSLFVIIVDLGFNQLTVREVSREKKLLTKYINNIIPIKIILSFVFIITIIIVIKLMNYPFNTRLVVYIFALYAVLNSFVDLFKSMFNAFEIMEYTSFIAIIEKIIVVSCGILLLLFKCDLIRVVSVYPLASFISIILCSIICAKKFFKFKLELNYDFCKYLILSSIPFGIYSIFITINYRIDTIMLSIIKGDYVVGWYNAAYTLVLALQVIPSSLISSLFPLLSRNSLDQRESSYIAYDKSLKYLIIIALPITAGTIILSDKIIMYIYGENFKASIWALQILILSIIPTFMHSVFGAIILATNEEKKAVWMWAICAVINVTLNYLIIPYYGLIGASITTLISEIIICFQFYHVISRYNYKIRFYELFCKPIIGSLIMSMFLLIFESINFKNENLVIVIIIAALVYLISILKIHIFSEEDLKSAKNILKR